MVDDLKKTTLRIREIESLSSTDPNTLSIFVGPVILT
jgi:hypothetical protein